MTDDLFKGLFYSYYKKYSTSFINKFVKIEASSTNPTLGQPRVLIDPSIDSSNRTDNWQSSSTKNSSITLTLLKERLLISSYSLRARTDSNANMPLEFVLEGSNNQVSWETIHHKENGTELVTAGSKKNFKCSSSIPFSCFKLTMLNENYHKVDSEKYLFTLSKIELFGKVVPTKTRTYDQRKMHDIQGKGALSIIKYYS